MKKITLCLMAIYLTLSFHPLQSYATTTVAPPSLVISKPKESAEAKALLLRLDEIKAKYKSTLSRKERKALRKEIYSIEKNLTDNHGGVYISVGAILIIILLLVIIF